tara:strand:+ start:2170 stop:4053 length:1884 start_codon:yes stop_codon:yes gene_type:complete
MGRYAEFGQFQLVLLTTELSLNIPLLPRGVWAMTKRYICRLVMIMGFLAISSVGFAQTTLNDLILYDYRDGAPVKPSVPGSVSLAKYHQWLLTYLDKHTPPRMVLYITDPCAPDITDPAFRRNWLNFYNPNANATDSTGKLTFVGFLKQANAHVDDIELLIDSASFNHNVTDPQNGCWNGSPSGQAMNPTLLPLAFERLPNVMGWLDAVMANTHLQGSNPVKALSLDPEGSGGTPYYIDILLWLDEYMTTLASPAVSSLDISMTLGFEAHTTTKLLVAELPAPVAPNVSISKWPADLWTTAQHTDHNYIDLLNANNGYLHWRTSSDPLLDRAYLQVYSACVPARVNGNTTSEFWRWINNSPTCDCSVAGTYTARQPADVASSLVKTMQRLPASCGPGTIEATQNGTQVKLIGTGSFIPFMQPYSRFRLDAGNGVTIPPNDAVWKSPSYTPMVDEMNITATGDSNGQSLPYEFTEITMDFRAPPMTDTSPDRIILMFSAEKSGLLPFFGWGTQTTFYQFIDEFINATRATDDASTVYVGSTGGLPVATNRFAIYDLKQICDNWNITNYGTTLCDGDVNSTLTVDIDDLLLVIENWGDSCTDGCPADTDGDNDVDIEDLLTVLAEYGDC